MSPVVERYGVTCAQHCLKRQCQVYFPQGNFRGICRMARALFLRGFLLVKTMRHAFDQLRTINGKNLQPYVKLSHVFSLNNIEWCRRLKPRKRWSSWRLQRTIGNSTVMQQIKIPWLNIWGKIKHELFLLAKDSHQYVIRNLLRMSASEIKITPKEPLQPLPLIKVPCKSSGMYLIGHWIRLYEGTVCIQS